MYHIPETCQQNSVCQNEKLGLSNTENSLVGFQADRVIYSLKVSFLWTSTSISSESRECKPFHRNSCTFSHFEKRHCTCDASSVDKKVSVNHSHFFVEEFWLTLLQKGQYNHSQCQNSKVKIFQQNSFLNGTVWLISPKYFCTNCFQSNFSNDAHSTFSLLLHL